MKLSQIRHLIAVADRGSLRSAARELGIAQPNITRSIRELEHELGATLFERHVSGVILTPIGAAVVHRARGIALEVQRTQDEVHQLIGNGVGQISIGLSTASHVALLHRVMGPFRKRYPDVHLTFREGLFPAIEADIQNGTVDFYIGPLGRQTEPSELTIETLFENRRLVVGRRGHPLAHARSLAELVDATWVATSVTIVSELELNPLFKEHGLPMPRILARAETALSMISLAAASEHLAMLPQQWEEFVRGTAYLQVIDVAEVLRAPPICSVRRARMPLTPAAEYLHDLFLRAAGNHARTLPDWTDPDAGTVRG